MTTAPVTDASALSIDRLESLMRGRSTGLDRLVWSLGGGRRTLTVGRRDLLLGLLGITVTVAIGGWAWTHLPPGSALLGTGVLWITLVRVIALLWPTRIVHERYASETALDTAVLVYWLVIDIPIRAVLAWAVATAVAELLRRHVLATAAINVGIGSTAALAAAGSYVTVLEARGLPVIHPLACVVAAAVYVLTDHVLTLGVVRAMGQRLVLGRITGGPVWLAITITVSLSVLVCAIGRLGTDSLLGGASVSVAMCLVIGLTSTLTAMADDRARLRRIVSFLHRMPTFPDDATAVRELERTARQIVGSRDVVVRPWPPAPARREVGFCLEGSLPRRTHEAPADRWLVARIRDLDPALHPAEESALETLALVAADGLALRRAAVETRWLATHDTLTRLANRAELLDRMVAAESPRQAAVGATSGVALIDIDGFKAVNDEISHEAGDHVLAALAPRIADAVADVYGEHGLAARLGGDEFAVLLPEVCSAARVEALCEAVRERIRRPVEWHGRLLHLDASIGYSVGPQIVTTSLLREADAAMYLVKRSGKGGIARYVAQGGDVADDIGVRALLDVAG